MPVVNDKQSVTQLKNPVLKKPFHIGFHKDELGIGSCYRLTVLQRRRSEGSPWHDRNEAKWWEHHSNDLLYLSTSSGQKSQHSARCSATQRLQMLAHEIDIPMPR